jgi:hypothetical protein
MKSGFAAALTAATVCLLFVSTGGILLWCLAQMGVSMMASMIEFFGILPQHWSEGNRLTLALIAGGLTLPVALWGGFRLFGQALQVERKLRAGS